MALRIELLAQLTSPDGEGILVPATVYKALKDFEEGHKSGMVKLEMKDGAVAGVKVEFAYK
jgi:hypothetical protein